LKGGAACGLPLPIARQWCAQTEQERTMNKHQVEGKRKQIHGEATDIKGDIKGDLGDDIKGKAEKAVGHVQEGYGNLKEKVKDKTTPKRP
jgi:uncharacterized protein YjbJ (UPF0337 family)